MKGVIPTVATDTVNLSDITQTTANLSGSVTAAGTASVTSRGFVYGISANPTTADSTVMAILGTGTGAFSATISGLAAGRTYHVRAYAISSAGTAYGEDRTFTTKQADSSNNGGDEKDSRSTGSATPIIQTYNAVVSQNKEQVATLPVTVVSGETTGSVSLTEAKAAEYFKSAADTIILVPAVPNVSSYCLKLPVDSLREVRTEKPLTFSAPLGSITIPGNMLAGIAEAEGKEAGVTIGQGDRANLTDGEKAAIGDRPLIQLTLMLNGIQTNWNNPSAPVIVSIPYKPAAEELKNPESLIIWYIDGSGKLICIPNGHYDAATGTVTFKTTHFSKYAVGCRNVSFKDVAESAWYHRVVSFIAARGITTGTGKGYYSPNANLTRGEFVVLLMRAYEIAPDINPGSNFTDVGSTYYTGYLSAAKRFGISEGIGNNRFAPEKEVTRQEMFVMLYNALRAMNRIPDSVSGKSLSGYKDASDIAPWARDAIKQLAESGIINGSDGSLNPAGTSTRAEAAQTLCNLLMK